MPQEGKDSANVMQLGSNDTALLFQCMLTIADTFQHPKRTPNPYLASKHTATLHPRKTHKKATPPHSTPPFVKIRISID